MKPARNTRQAFTLIEMLLVVAVIGIALTLSYPAMSKMVHRAPLTQAVLDVEEACRNARAQAILHSVPMELRIYPKDYRIEVSEAPADVPVDLAAGAVNVTPGSGQLPGVVPENPDSPKAEKKRYEPKSPFRSQVELSPDVHLDMLDVNFADCLQDDVAHVRFFPNGTSDEFTFIISQNGETRKFTLEVVTGLLMIKAL